MTTTAVAKVPVTIVTPAPIPIADLKRKFHEDVQFVIDYDASKFKDRTLITYLGNLDLNCRIQLVDQESSLELVAAYMRHPGMAKIDDLLEVVINVLLAYVGKPNALTVDLSGFIVKHMDILDIWMRRIASLYLYTFQCDKTTKPEFWSHWPEDEDTTLAGINFVHLIKHPLFHLLIDGLPEQCWTWNKFWFKEYCFGGRNLYTFYAVPENPLYMAILANYNMDPVLLDNLIKVAQGEEDVSFSA